MPNIFINPFFGKIAKKHCFLPYIHIFKENGLSEVHQIENSDGADGWVEV